MVEMMMTALTQKFVNGDNKAIGDFIDERVGEMPFGASNDNETGWFDKFDPRLKKIQNESEKVDQEIQKIHL